MKAWSPLPSPFFRKKGLLRELNTGNKMLKKATVYSILNAFWVKASATSSFVHSRFVWLRSPGSPVSRSAAPVPPFRALSAIAQTNKSFYSRSENRNFSYDRMLSELERLFRLETRNSQIVTANRLTRKEGHIHGWIVQRAIRKRRFHSI